MVNLFTYPHFVYPLSVANLKNKFKSRVITILRNKALRFDVASHMMSHIECEWISYLDNHGHIYYFLYYITEHKIGNT